MRKHLSSSIFLIILILVICIPVYADGLVVETVPKSNLSVLPLYDGNDYAVIQDNVPDFTEDQLVLTPYVWFSELDDLGRTGPAMACLGPETLPATARGVIGDIRPSGWHTVRYDDLIEDRYLYNRAHVIGFMLCGDNSTPENLFTGTRHLNAVGMFSYENKVLDYIAQTKNHVMYRCSPHYAGDDLVASGVQMEAYSVEDAGELCFNVFVFNVQPGIVIDYATGNSERAQVVSDDSSDRTGTQQTELQPSPSSAVTYVLNTNTHKFHRPSCSSVKDIKSKNRKDFSGTREEAIAAGYDPCGRCHP